MSSIIEKLELDKDFLVYGEVEPGNTDGDLIMVSQEDLDNLENQRNELLKALIKSVISIEKILYEVKPNLWSNVRHELDVAYSKGKEAILNTDPSHRQFEEFKELLYETI